MRSSFDINFPTSLLIVGLTFYKLIHWVVHIHDKVSPIEGRNAQFNDQSFINTSDSLLFLLVESASGGGV